MTEYEVCPNCENNTPEDVVYNNDPSMIVCMHCGHRFKAFNHIKEEIEVAVHKFAEEMKRVMIENAREKRNSWKDTTIRFMDEKLVEEVLEYLVIHHGYHDIISMVNSIHAVTKTKEGQERKELTDIGNVCMMLFDLFKPKEEKPDGS